MHKVNPQIAIFASGQGSNAEALMDAFLKLQDKIKLDAREGKVD